MNRPVLYFRSANILINAYQNETLYYNSTNTCSIANLIAANMGFTIIPHWASARQICATWKKVTKDIRWRDTTWHDLLKSPSLVHRFYLRKQIGDEQYESKQCRLQSTGYSLGELKQIMRAFDKCYDGVDNRKNILPGLNSVLKALKQIHRVSTLDVEGQYWINFMLENSLIAALPDEYEWLQKLKANRYYPYEKYIADKQIYHVLGNRNTVSVSINPN